MVDKRIERKIHQKPILFLTTTSIVLLLTKLTKTHTSKDRILAKNLIQKPTEKRILPTKVHSRSTMSNPNTWVTFKQHDKTKARQFTQK